MFLKPYTERTMNYLIKRAKEKSTWLGLTALLTAFGVAMSPEQLEAIATLGVSIAGAISVFWKDSE